LAVSKIPKPQAIKAGIAEGFTPRSTGAKVDGRSLRRTGRGVQFNISVSQKSKDVFWKMARDGGFSSGGEFLELLLESNKT
jgi:hypothetical protein